VIDERFAGLPTATSVGVWLWLSCGCVSQPSGEAPELLDASQVESASLVACGPASAQAVALLDARDGGCGLALEFDAAGSELIVRPRARPNPLIEAEPIARGLAPEACGPAASRCELFGVTDRLGPIVIAGVRGSESEMLTQVFVGWVEGQRLAFVETWFGPPSVVDHTRVGPAWALAPFDCSGVLQLLPAPRLPEADHEDPPDQLPPVAGAWSIDDQGLAQPPAQPSTTDPANCRALIPALP
jgi:hypothetical protein